MAGESKILTHWKEFQPTLVKRLRQEGRLQPVLQELAERVVQSRADLMQQGLDWYQADELVRPMWQLPDETVEPVVSEPALTTHQAALPAIASRRDG